MWLIPPAVLLFGLNACTALDAGAWYPASGQPLGHILWSATFLVSVAAVLYCMARAIAVARDKHRKLRSR
jgi:hypothetical protein